MATLYWYGGTGSWNAATGHWSTNSGNSPAADHVAPIATDDVVFDTLSNATAYTVTITGTSVCQNCTVGNPLAGVITWDGSGDLTVKGNISFPTGMLKTDTGTLTMNATSGTKTITNHGVSWANRLTLNGSGGTFQLADNFTSSSSIPITRTNGTFDAVTNNTTCTFTVLGPSINNDFTGVNAFYNLSFIPSSPSKLITFKCNANFEVKNILKIDCGATVTNRCIFSSLTRGSVLTVTLGGIPSINNTDFLDVTFQSTNARTITGVADDGSGKARFTTTSAHGLVNGSTIVIAGTTNYNGAATVTNVSDTIHFDVSALSYVSSQTGTWTFDLSSATGGSGNCGNNTGITFTTAANTTCSSGATWSTATWSTRVPLPQDTAFFSGGSRTITQDMPRIGNVDFSGSSGLTWTTSLATSCFGSIILTNLAALTSSTQVYTMEGRTTTYTIDSAGLTFEKNITINCINGTYNIGAGNLTLGTTRRLTITSGIFNCNTYVLSTGLFTMASGTTTLSSATHLITGTGTTTWNVTSGTLSASTGTIKFTDTATAAGITFVGGGKTYNNIWFARGANTQSHTITGNNTFVDFKDDGTAAHSILFTAASTQIVTTFTVNGNPGAAITLNSTTTGVFNLTKAGGGNILCDWLNVQHAACLPNGAWFARSSVNNQPTTTAGSKMTFISSLPVSSFFN